MINSNVKLIWFEDFLVLCSTQSFSQAAGQRHVSQPAFSRRMQMLENWLGVALVDRSTQAFKLTGTGVRFEPEIRALVNRVYEMRREILLDNEARQRTVLTAQHMLTISHLPGLLRTLAPIIDGTVFRVRSDNYEECVGQFVRGEANLLLCCESNDEQLPTGDFDAHRLVVGRDRLIPIRAAETKMPMHKSSRAGSKETGRRALKLLNYPETSFFGKVVWRHCLPGIVAHYEVETVCVSGFTLGLKEMVLSGLGMAWLPEGLIRDELERGTLVSMEPDLASADLQVSLFCSAGEDSAVVRDIWKLLGASCADAIDA